MSTTPDDFTACIAACQSAQDAGDEISDGCARTIAALYADDKAGYALATTGAILDDVWHSLFGPLYAGMPPEEQLLADMLGAYLVAHGERGPVPGWSNCWVR